MMPSVTYNFRSLQLFRILIFFLCLSLQVEAQTPQALPVFLGEGIPAMSCPSQKSAVDMDGDGDLDLLVVPLPGGHDEMKLSWFENDEQGGFSEHTIHSTSGLISGAYAIDIDEDGDKDIITSIQERTDDGEVQRRTVWWENSKNIPLEAHELSVDFWYLDQVTVIDFDQDGDEDILFSNRKGNTMAWYENQGQAQFTEHALPLPSGISDLSVRDFDGDKDIDLLYFSASDQAVGWYERQNDQRFTAHIIDSSSTDPRLLSLVDLDADGDLDVLSMTGMQNRWYENNGKQQFAQHTAPSVTDSYSFSLGDLDGDGLSDLISMGPYQMSKYAFALYWYKNLGAGQFGKQILITNQHNGEHSDLLVSDIDNDGRLDILTGCGYYLNVLPSNVTKHPIANVAFASFRAGDLDGDGDVDIVNASIREPGINWYEQQTNGKFVAQVLSADIKVSTLIQLTDLDKDEDLDLLYRTGDKTAWLQNQGRSKFNEKFVALLDKKEGFAPPIDLNGDGYPDLLVVGFNSDKTRCLVNQQGRKFEERSIDIQFDRGSIIAADLDGDGDQDLCSVGNMGPSSWYENVGKFRLVKHQFYQEGTMSPTPQATHVADINGDGLMDILFSLRGDPEYRASGYLGLSINKGGQFETQVIYQRDTQSIKSADIDKDGDIDIVAPFGKLIMWLENDGKGNFSDHLITTGRTNSIHLADMDEDGDVDIIANGQTLNWYEIILKQN